MFRISLRLVRKSDEELVLAPVPLFRILFALMFGALLTGALLNAGEPVPVLGFILLALSFLGIFYDERWIFHRGRNTVESRFGLLFLSRKEVFPFPEIREFSYSRKNAGGLPEGQGSPGGFFLGRGVQYSIFSLLLADGTRKNIEVIKSRTPTGLGDQAGTIAGFCGIPLAGE